MCYAQWALALEVYDTKKAGSTAPGYNVLLKKDSSLPKPVTDLYDANCYARVEEERDRLFNGLADKIKGKYVDDPYYDIFNPSGPVEYSHIEQGLPLTKDAYKVSADGQLAVNRKTPFGLKPILTNVFAPNAVFTPKTLKSNKGSIPKFGKDQFLEKATVEFHDWNTLVDIAKQIGTCSSGALAPGPGEINLGVCKCGSTDALVYYKSSQPPPLFYSSEGILRTWNEYFQDDTPSPRTTHPAFEYFINEFNGDFLSKVVGFDTKSPKFSQNMLSTLPSEWWRAPGIQFWTKPSTIAKPKYKAGMFAQSNNGQWTIATGTWFSALQAHGLLTTLPDIGQTWTWSADGRVGIGATRAILLNHTVTNKVEAIDKISPGMADYFEVTMAASSYSDTTPYDFASNTSGQVIASAHLGANKWHPQGDEWVSNWSNLKPLETGDRVIPALASFAPSGVAKGNAFVPEWAPRRSTYVVPEIDDFEARVKRCDVKTYHPFEPATHWPRVSSAEPLAFLWGKADGVRAAFPADLVDVPLKPGTGRLHEGLDINWQIKRERDVEPAYGRVFGAKPAEYCSGTFWIEATELKFAMPCSSEVFSLCGEKAKSGCNPAEQANAKIASECHLKECWEDAKSCGIFAPVCSIATCAKDAAKCVAGGAKWAYNILRSYVGGPICLVFTNQPCNEEQLNVYRQPFLDQEMDAELEHRFTFRGMRDHGDPDFMCPETFVSGQCTYENYPQYNAIYEELIPTEFEPFHKWEFTNVQLKLKDDLAPKGGGMGADLDTVYPFTLAPGLVGDRRAPFGRVASVFGHGHGTFNPLTESFRVLPKSIAEALLAKDAGFRTEFVGDAVIDCGHMPVHTEIHPPTNLMLHLGDVGGDMMRYSILGIHRKNQLAPADFDLWPGPRKPGKTKLKWNIVFPAATSKEPPMLSCAPYPESSPNRLRCNVINDGALYDKELCAKNPNFLPSCAQGIGGGLLDVGWE